MTRKHGELNDRHTEASDRSDKARRSRGKEYIRGVDIPNDDQQITKSPRVAASSNESRAREPSGQDLRFSEQYSGPDSLGLLKSAAKKGNGEAQKLLGELYLVGRWVERDYQQADVWLRRAASNNVPSARNLLQRGGVFRLRRKNMMRKHLDLARTLDSPGDLEFLHRAAEEEMGEAQGLLGEMYLTGNGVRCDRRRAAMWLSRAAKHKCSGADSLLRQHLRRAAQHNGPDGMDFLEGAGAEGVDEARFLLKYLVLGAKHVSD